MMSTLGQGASAYSSRPGRSKRITRLSTSLSSLAQIGETPGDEADDSSPSSVKKWTREIPGMVNDIGDVVRSNSPLRLSSTSRATLQPSRQNARKSSISWNTFFYRCF